LTTVRICHWISEPSTLGLSRFFHRCDTLPPSVAFAGQTVNRNKNGHSNMLQTICYVFGCRGSQPPLSAAVATGGVANFLRILDVRCLRVRGRVSLWRDSVGPALHRRRPPLRDRARGTLGPSRTHSALLHVPRLINIRISSRSRLTSGSPSRPPNQVRLFRRLPLRRVPIPARTADQPTAA